MCVVSMISEGWKDQFPHRYPNIDQFINHPTRAEFEQLKKEMQELRELLLHAKEFDKNNNQPHCEQDEKVKFIKQIADALGVDMSEVFGG